MAYKEGTIQIFSRSWKMFKMLSKNDEKEIRSYPQKMSISARNVAENDERFSNLFKKRCSLLIKFLTKLSKNFRYFLDKIVKDLVNNEKRFLNNFEIFS